jgi:hypothetical protein
MMQIIKNLVELEINRHILPRRMDRNNEENGYILKIVTHLKLGCNKFLILYSKEKSNDKRIGYI